METPHRVPALVFDLDGTLVDSVYQHVLAWQQALRDEGIEISVWRIHRKIGMSGGLFAHALLRETKRDLPAEVLERLPDAHVRAYAERADQVRPLPGARELLERLTSLSVPWAIATSGRIAGAAPTLEQLPIPAGTPVVTRDDVSHAKPAPDLFVEAMRRLGVSATDAFVVGDSVWDMLAARRAGTLGIGLLSGGYGQEELEKSGAYRVYEDPADLLNHLDEIGIRDEEY